MTQKQYERIIGLVGRGSVPTRLEPEKVHQDLNASARIARSGRLHEAEVLISSLPLDGPLGPATLDLKAKLCAQQGRLVEAQLCWMEAVRQSPGNESYRRSLAYVTRVLRPSRFSIIIYMTVLALLAVIAALCVGIARWRP